MKDFKHLVTDNRTPSQDQAPKKENLSYRARPAWRNQWQKIILVLLLTVVFGWAFIRGEIYFSVPNLRVVLVVTAAVWAYLALTILYRRYAWRYSLNADNVESRQGLIARKIHSIRLRDLRNINVNQSFMQRILGVGDVEFSSSAGSEVEVVFFGVSRPMQVKNLTQRLQGR